MPPILLLPCCSTDHLVLRTVHDTTMINVHNMAIVIFIFISQQILLTAPGIIDVRACSHAALNCGQNAPSVWYVVLMHPYGRRHRVRRNLWKLRRAQQQYQMYRVVHSTVSILILTTICAKLIHLSTIRSLTMDDKGDDQVAHGQQKIRVDGYEYDPDDPEDDVYTDDAFLTSKADST
jgi:hypothetical protein